MLTKKDVKMKSFLNGQNICVIIGHIKNNGVYVLGTVILEVM